MTRESQTMSRTQFFTYPHLGGIHVLGSTDPIFVKGSNFMFTKLSKHYLAMVIWGRFSGGKWERQNLVCHTSGGIWGPKISGSKRTLSRNCVLDVLGARLRYSYMEAFKLQLDQQILARYSLYNHPSFQCRSGFEGICLVAAAGNFVDLCWLFISFWKFRCLAAATLLFTLLSRDLLWIFSSNLPGNFALKNGGEFWWIFSGLRFPPPPRNEARKLLKKFRENSEQNLGQNSDESSKNSGNFRSATFMT